MSGGGITDMTFTYDPSGGDDEERAAAFEALFGDVNPPTLIHLSESGVGTY